MAESVLLYEPAVPETLRQKALDAIAHICQTPAIALDVDTPPNETDERYLFTLLSDESFLNWVESAPKAKLIIPLPWEQNPLQKRHFCLPDKIESLLNALHDHRYGKLHTQLYCNDRPLFGTIEIGHRIWRDKASLGTLFRGLFSLKMREIQLSTAKAHTFKTAAIQIEAGSEATLSCLRTRFFHPDDNHCDRSAALIYAPQSVMDALKLRLFLANRAKPSATDSLPEGIGTVKSRTITIESADGTPLPVRINGQKKGLPKITLESRPLGSPLFYGKEGCTQKGDEKESIRTQNLPLENDLISFFTKRTLPLVPIASESAFADLFTRLREAAAMPFYYIALLLISVLMATTGLFQDSSPTIIGAMILAPLMAPIIAFAMGAIRFDTFLLQKSAKTILFSIIIALFASALAAFLLPFAHVTEQMAVRTHPTLLDLAVAVLSGISAAYGYANSKVGESLAGVAIAVALVPPLCVAGIGIGWGSWLVFGNAFLLFLANIAGILVAAGATFYLLGYASRRYASTAFVVKLLMVALIAVPLWLSTRTLVAEERIFKAFEAVKTIPLGSFSAHLYLRTILPKAEGLHAVIYVTTPMPLDPEQKSRIARRLHEALGENVKLVLTFQELY